MNVVNQLNEDELEKVSEMLRVSEAMDKGDPNLLGEYESATGRNSNMGDFVDGEDGETVFTEAAD